MDSDYSLSSLLAVIKKWIGKILVATLFIAVVSALISLALPDYYKASTTFYASNPDLASAPGIGPTNEPLYIFGNENDLDRLISLANSSEIQKHLIRKFDLYKHYGMDSTSAKAELEMDMKFKSLFKTVKTKYDAVELTVEDKDPELAAKIAKEAREASAKLAQQWIVKSQSSVTTSYDQNIADLEKRGKILNDSMQYLKRANQIFDSRYQLEAIAFKITQNNDNLYNSQAKVKFYQRHSDPDSLRKYMAMQASSENLKTYYDKQTITFNSVWSQLLKLEQEFIRLTDQISITRERKDQLNSYANASIKTTLVVDEVSVPKVKSRPKRMIIVLACTLVGFALSLFGALMIENLRRSHVS